MNQQERSDILRKAIDVINELGWTKAPLPEKRPMVCLTEAVCAAAGLDRNWQYSYPILGHEHENYSSRKESEESKQQARWPWVWNDREDVTKEDVVSMLEFLADTGMSWDDAIEIWYASKVEIREEVLIEA